MAINKVVYGNNTLMDITDTTATADDVASGEVFYRANGVRTVGTGSGGSAIPTLSGTIYVQDLADGLYYLAPEASVYTYQDSSDLIGDMECGGLLRVTTADNLLSSGEGKSYLIIGNYDAFENDGGSVTSINQSNLIYTGYVIEETGDWWAGLTGKRIEDFTDPDDVEKAICEFVAPPWSRNATYNQGDLVSYAWKMYYCTSDNVTGAWNSNYWVQSSLRDFFYGMSTASYYTGDIPVNIGGIFEYIVDALMPGLIVSQYSAYSTYSVGDYTMYEDGLYKCTTAITTNEAWNSNHWTRINIATSMTKSEAIAPDYSAGTTYSIGDYVMHNGNLYVCNVDMTTLPIADPTWVPNHWTQTSVSSILGNINSALGGI